MDMCAFLSCYFSIHLMSLLLFKETAMRKKRSENIVPLPQLKQETELTIL